MFTPPKPEQIPETVRAMTIEQHIEKIVGHLQHLQVDATSILNHLYHIQQKKYGKKEQ